MINLIKNRAPQVSIVIPTYNCEKYLKFAIDSVLSQSFRDFEFIIVNDGSTDGTEKLINKYNDDRIIYVRQKNLGEYPATNLGMRIARGKYMTWIHSDDVWPRNSLKIRVNGLNKNKKIDLVHGDIKWINEKGKVIKYLPAVNLDPKKIFLEYYTPLEKRVQEFLVHHTTFLFHRNFILKNGFLDETLPFGGDYDWMLRALLVGRFKKVNGILYYYRRHLLSRSSTDCKKGINTHKVNIFIRNRYKKYAKTKNCL